MLNNIVVLKKKGEEVGGNGGRFSDTQKENGPFQRSDGDGKRRCTWLVRYEEKERRLYNFSVDRHTKAHRSFLFPSLTVGLSISSERSRPFDSVRPVPNVSNEEKAFRFITSSLFPSSMIDDYK